MITAQIKSHIKETEFKKQFSRYLYLKNYQNYFKDKRVLDLACGLGYGSYFIKKYLGAKEVIGVDLDKSAIDYAKNNFKCSGLKFFCDSSYDFSKFKEYNHYFSTVVTFETIEHVTSPSLFLKELNCLSKKSSIFFLSTPNKDLVSPYVAYPIYRYHLKEFKDLELKKFIKECNFKIVSFRYEITEKSLFIKFRTAICYFFSFLKLKIMSRFLELIFYNLKRVINYNSKYLEVKKKIIKEYRIDDLNNFFSNKLGLNESAGGFFIVFKK